MATTKKQIRVTRRRYCSNGWLLLVFVVVVVVVVVIVVVVIVVISSDWFVNFVENRWMSVLRKSRRFLLSIRRCQR